MTEVSTTGPATLVNTGLATLVNTGLATLVNMDAVIS